uniref:Uncharacterized protein n=1 Tax=Caenorhabditis japonica TaxID=281687 RepID=A0A8R1DFW9_CAEJA
MKHIHIQFLLGKCDLSAAPPSWLSTNGTGIIDWATAGRPVNGTNFCIQGDRKQKVVQVAYHIKLDNNELEPVNSQHAKSSNQNGCVNNDTRIVYCFPLCFNETLQYMVIESALKSKEPAEVALDIQQTTQLDWAITVLQVDYNDPKTHLNASVFLEPDSWCSVYVGIKPTLGFDYLYEIQLGRIIDS